MINTLEGTISAVEEITKEARDSHIPEDENSRRDEKYEILFKGIYPNIVGMHQHFEDLIREAKDPLEVLDLKEQRFVATIGLLTHPEVKSRLEIIGEKINAGYENGDKPAYVGMVLIGSAAFGGLLIRDAIGLDRGDIDMIGTYINNTDFPTTISPEGYFFTTVAPEVKELFNSSELKGPESPDYELCAAHNIGIQNFQTFDSEDEARAMLDRIDTPNGDYSGTITLYMLPSYPHVFNDVNRLYILNALRTMAKEDHEKWERVTGYVIEGFNKSVKPLKPKHFGKEDTPDLIEKLEPFNDYVGKVFSDLIHETEKTD